MKKMFAWVMALTMLLCAACGRQPEAPESPETPEPPQQEQPVTPETPEQPVAPETPEVPETPEAPETPVTPEAPEVPVIVEPEGFVSVVRLPSVIPGLLSVADMVPLGGDLVALLGYADSAAYIMIYDYKTTTVLCRMEVEHYDEIAELELLDKDPYTLVYYGDRGSWDIKLDENWKMTAEKYDPALYLSVMGDLMIVQESDSISVGRVIPGTLQGNDRVAYQFVRVLDDHRLLYQAMDRSIPSLSHYGVYDHDTGETRALTTIGQTVVGNWGDILLIARNGDGGWYDFATISLEDYTYTSLKIGHETSETGINSDCYGQDSIQCNADTSCMLLIWAKDDIRTVQVVDLETGAELYRWERPAEEPYQFYLAGDNELIVRRDLESDSILWKVEY